ncbi:MAG TPA: arylamine N-acetyltransferase [Thermoanaerobaculia bacterium]
MKRQTGMIEEIYLRKLGLVLPLAPVIETLRLIHVAHLSAFTFDNLEIQRGGTIRLDPESLVQGFLSRGGGYCFEHNTVLATVLRELGFEVRVLLGRAGPRETRALNHMLLRVDVGGEPWIADTGFGGEGLLEPIPLRENVRVAQGGIEYTFHRDEHHWTLMMHYGERSEFLYEFADAPHTMGDIEIANYYTATHDSSIFRRTLTIQRSTGLERIILRPSVVTRYIDGARTDTAIDPSQLRALALELFGIELGETPLLFESARPADKG